jgi:hypothetical protein
MTAIRPANPKAGAQASYKPLSNAEPRPRSPARRPYQTGVTPLALDILLTALKTRCSLGTSTIPLPGLAEGWDQALFAVDGAYDQGVVLRGRGEARDQEHSWERDIEAELGL